MRSVSLAVKNINYVSTSDDLEKYISSHQKEHEYAMKKWFYQPAYRYTSAEVGHIIKKQP